MLLVALLVLSAAMSMYMGSLLGLVVYLCVVCGLYNLWVRAFKRAGPYTSRQIPPQRIARCQQMSAQELNRAYKSGTLRCEEVVQTYIDHIRRVNPYINAMVFECFDEALNCARAADVTWAQWRLNPTRIEEPSWLLGVPCTVKECMECAGCPNSSGHPIRRGVIADTDSPVIRNFRDAGAIILGVTNVSEMCMWYESSNYVYGITSNPYDTRCLVGGSSGGEGSAAGAVFSTFSIGSDIGGSLRMPAHFNGVFAYKSSPHFISNQGQHPSPVSSAHHYMTTGPITRFPQDIVPLVMVAARGGFHENATRYPPAQPRLHTVDLRGRRLRVFALEDYGVAFIPVSPSQRAAVHECAETLRTCYGAEVTYVNVRDASRCTGGVVPAPFLPFRETLSMWASVLTTDPEEKRFNEFMSEGLGEGVRTANWFAELGRWMIGRSEHTLPAILLCIAEVIEWYVPASLLTRKVNSVQPFRQQLIDLLGEDGVIITPTFPSAAPQHHHPLWNPLQFQYTAAFNVLQLPVMSFPVWTGMAGGSRGDPEEVMPVEMVEAVDIMSCRNKSLTRQECRRRGLPDDFHLPKGVQIVGAPMQDGLCVSVALALDRILGGYHYPGWALLEGRDY